MMTKAQFTTALTNKGFTEQDTDVWELDQLQVKCTGANARFYYADIPVRLVELFRTNGVSIRYREVGLIDFK